MLPNKAKNMSEIRYEIDRSLDVFTAFVKDEIRHPIETIESELFDGNILFQVDAVTGDLIKIVVYDFSIIRRKLLMKLIFLYTTRAIKNWLAMIITAFQAGKKSVHVPA
jgi:hypothetical protein